MNLHCCSFFGDTTMRLVQGVFVVVLLVLMLQQEQEIAVINAYVPSPLVLGSQRSTATGWTVNPTSSRTEGRLITALKVLREPTKQQQERQHQGEEDKMIVVVMNEDVDGHNDLYHRDQTTTEMMRRDIEIMRQEAQRRLDVLSVRMEQLKSTSSTRATPTTVRTTSAGMDVADRREQRRKHHSQQEQQEQHESNDSDAVTTDDVDTNNNQNNKDYVPLSQLLSLSSSLDSMEGDMTKQPPLLVKQHPDVLVTPEQHQQHTIKHQDSMMDIMMTKANSTTLTPTPHSKGISTTPETATTTTTVANPSRLVSSSIPLSSVSSLNLLENTRWKIAFNVGRERGTWMPKSWGQSGERIVFHVILDFTNETIYERDDFFLGGSTSSSSSSSGTTVSGPIIITTTTTKRLDIVEAWLVPRGVGQASMGRRAIAIKPTGTYKVACGQGPLGTDVVRLYIELEEEIRLHSDSDVYCPMGRIYGTCGYFVMPHHAQSSSSLPITEKSSSSSTSSVSSLLTFRSKEELAKEYQRGIVRCEQIETELEAQDNIQGWIMNMNYWKLQKQLWDQKDKVQQLERLLYEARQRQPDKSQLRLSKTGCIGLSKEGGICCKIQKGLALEYRILGRMELACLLDPIPANKNKSNNSN